MLNLAKYQRLLDQRLSPPKMQRSSENIKLRTADSADSRNGSFFADRRKTRTIFEVKRNSKLANEEDEPQQVSPHHITLFQDSHFQGFFDRIAKEPRQLNDRERLAILAHRKNNSMMAGPVRGKLTQTVSPVNKKDSIWERQENNFKNKVPLK